MRGIVTRDVSIKGVSPFNLRNFVLEKYGEAELERVAQSLPPDCAAILRSPFANEWYPLRARDE